MRTFSVLHSLLLCALLPGMFLLPACRHGEALRNGKIAFRTAQTRSEKQLNAKKILLQVPAIVQARKGYCAPATIARALAYSGVPVSQRTIALYSGTSPEHGVNVTLLYERLQTLFARKYVQLFEYVPVDASRALKLAEGYNALAALLERPELVIPKCADGDPLYLDQLFSGADPDLLRIAASEGLAEFERTLVSALSEDTPLLWGVLLGIVKEKNAPGVRGGHLRLIVGFDPEKRLVYYSDSWVVGCPVKTMHSTEAWAITMSLHALRKKISRLIPGVAMRIPRLRKSR